MNEGFQFLDIILFAMVAAFLVLRLRSVLGRRTGNEERPPDLSARREHDTENENENEGNVIELADRTGSADDGEDLAKDAESDDPLVAGIAQIRLSDSKFDLNEFQGGARSAFEMVVHAFATADSGTLRSLLSEEVAENFQNAIKERLEAGETLETTVIGIKSTEVIEAEMRGRDAALTLKFVSEQVNVTRDTEGRVIEGDPNQVTDITDIWTFARNTRARDPNWKLIETRSPN
jgi:predicted lipid-binding transport protein (Tim44 family)